MIPETLNRGPIGRHGIECLAYGIENPRSRYSANYPRPLFGNVLPKLPERFGILYAVSGVSAPVEPKSTLRSLAV